jgi:uncharacterized membrane protein
MLGHILNIQGIEAVWVSIAVVGLVFAGANILHSNEVLRLLKSVNVHDGRIVRLAIWSRRTEFVRVMIQTIHLVIGLIAFTLPPQQLGEISVKYQVSALLVRYGLVMSAGLTCLQSINSYLMRRELLEDNEEVQDGKTNSGRE